MQVSIKMVKRLITLTDKSTGAEIQVILFTSAKDLLNKMTDHIGKYENLEKIIRKEFPDMIVRAEVKVNEEAL